LASIALAHQGLPFAGELPSEFSPQSFAGACRRAYTQLLSGVGRGWGKPELAAWLKGPYARLAIDEKGSSVPPPSSGEVSQVRVAGLLDAMRVDVLLVLREIMVPEGLAAFAQHSVDTELVARSVDVDGEVAFVPRARARMTFVDRALSLIAVDTLIRPDDYTTQLFVCSRCDMPIFDATARPLGVCPVHQSGVNAL
jgi:hypothetical protein